MYEVIYRKSAAKSLIKLPSKISAQFVQAFEMLAIDNGAELDIKKLTGREGFRLRIGDYRAIYRKLNDVMIIDVVKVGSRGDVYK